MTLEEFKRGVLRHFPNDQWQYETSYTLLRAVSNRREYFLVVEHYPSNQRVQWSVLKRYGERSGFGTTLDSALEQLQENDIRHD